MSTNRHKKTTLIREHLFPLLGSLSEADTSALSTQLDIHAQMRSAVPGQYLEEPGPSDEGMAFLLPESMAHSFQILDALEDHITGTHIWARRTLVFDPHALLDRVPRADYVQVLEPGPYLCIRYPALRQLMADFDVVERGIAVLARQQERQRLAYHLISRLPPADRVAAFERQFRSFAHLASIQTRSLHVGLSRQTYSKKLKAL